MPMPVQKFKDSIVPRPSAAADDVVGAGPAHRFRKDHLGGYLEVGISPDRQEVIVNHPDLKPDENGVGHIVFSPSQARNFAYLLIQKANEIDL